MAYISLTIFSLLEPNPSSIIMWLKRVFSLCVIISKSDYYGVVLSFAIYIMLWGVVLSFKSVNETLACCPTNGGILGYSMLNCSLHEFCFRLIQNENRLQNLKSSSNTHPSTQHSSTMVKPSFLTWKGVRNRLALCCSITISSASAIAKRKENLFWYIMSQNYTVCKSRADLSN